jgi:hypothetical protein
MRALAIGLLTMALCAPAGRSQNSNLPIPWSRIIWSDSNTNGKRVEHAVLLLEVQIPGIGKPIPMQLDTGCDANLVYDIPFGQLGLDFARSGPNKALLSGSIGGYHFDRETFYIRKTASSWLSLFLFSIQERIAIWKGRQVLLGTIGAAFVERRVLLLDFVADRLAVLREGQELSPAIAARTAFAPIEYRDRKLFVTVTINGNTYGDLAFDTGSSAMPVSTTKDRWLKWTGRSANDPNNTVMRVWSWDRYVTLIGAPIRGTLCVGGACLDSPLAFFESSGAPNADFNRYPFYIGGVFGNALFDRRFTVILDVPHRRFGLFRGSLSQAGLL